MRFFDKLTDIFKTNSGQEITLGVAMLGPRGVGKTSILTSIFHDSDTHFMKSRLYFNPDSKTGYKLKCGYEELSSIFDNYQTTQEIVGIKATSEKEDSTFSLGLLGKAKSVKVVINDYPGEWVDANNPNNHLVTSLIVSSQLIMVAIDTVHLMEMDGMYNEVRNRSEEISETLLKIFASMDKRERKLVMLVPLKCEKYVVECRMEELADKVIKAYGTLIKGVEGKYKDRVGLAITPIQTLGGVVFDRFGKDSNGEIIIDSLDNAPQKAVYRLHRVMMDRPPMYMPAYCVQPLKYLISFALNEYRNSQSSGGFISPLFKSICSFFSSDEKFFQACYDFVGTLKSSGHGFRVLNNPKMF